VEGIADDTADVTLGVYVIAVDIANLEKDRICRELNERGI